MRPWWLVPVLLAASPPAGAYQRTTVPNTSICLYWNDRLIRWTPSEAGNAELGVERTLDVIRVSFRTWQDVNCSDVAFAETAPSSSRSVGWRRDEPSDDLILFRNRRCIDKGGAPPGDRCWLENDCSNVYDCWSFADGDIAVTTTSYNASTGELIDADIELNAANFRFTAADGPRCEPGKYDGCVATDLQNTVTHEIGHVLGLAHSDDPDATMSADAPLGDVTKRSLGADDVEAICSMYPPGGPPLTCFEKFRLVPVERSGAGCAAGGGTLAGLLACVGAWLPLLRRRSGRRAGAGGRGAG